MPGCTAARFVDVARSAASTRVDAMLDAVTSYDETRLLMEPDDFEPAIDFADLFRRPAWMASAACRGAGTELFFRRLGCPSNRVKSNTDHRRLRRLHR
jgi:hypothetical protein